MRVMELETPHNIDVRKRLLESWAAHRTEIFEKRWNLA